MRVCVFEFLALTLGLFTVRDAEKWVSLKFFSQMEVDFLLSHQNKLFCVRRESFLIEDLFSVTSPWLIEYQALLRHKMHLWWGFLCSFDLSLEKENIQVIHAEPRLSVVFYLLTQMEATADRASAHNTVFSSCASRWLKQEPGRSDAATMTIWTQSAPCWFTVLKTRFSCRVNFNLKIDLGASSSSAEHVLLAQ